MWTAAVFISDAQNSVRIGFPYNRIGKTLKNFIPEKYITDNKEMYNMKFIKVYKRMNSVKN